MQPESSFKQKLVRSFKKYGGVGRWYTYVVKGRGMKSGMPDLLFGRDGGLVWVEAKMEGNELSKQQVRTIRQLRSGGARVLIVTHQPGRPLDILVNGEAAGDWAWVSKVRPLDEGFWDRFFTGWQPT